MEPRFYFSVCQAGAEKAVKDEVLALNPGLRFAFSRPGFITFKEPEPQGAEITHPGSLFTRLWGVSLGQAGDPEGIRDLLSRIPEGALIQAFDRETCLPGDEPEGSVKGGNVRRLLDGSPLASQVNLRVPKPGEWVYDLIWIEEGRLFLGCHRFEEGMDPAPGNDPLIVLPKDSPSRALLKIEEAIHRFAPVMRPGLSVLEVGCSPGGATSAMLGRGFKVVGIDPKRMAPVVESHPDFRLIQKPAGKVQEQELRGINPEWMVLDINLAPLEALDELNHVIRTLRAQQGARLRLTKGFLTVKLNDWGFVSSIPLYLKRISELGFEDLTAVQLCSNRQEFFVYARSFR